MSDQPQVAPVKFQYGVHDSSNSYERLDFIMSQTGLEFSEDFMSEHIGRPFYEVVLDCDIHPETGKIRLLGVQGVSLEAPIALN